MITAVFVASLLTAIIGVVLLIPRLHRPEIVGRDMHKLGQPPVAEMGASDCCGSPGPSDELVCTCMTMLS